MCWCVYPFLLKPVCVYVHHAEFVAEVLNLKWFRLSWITWRIVEYWIEGLPASVILCTLSWGYHQQAKLAVKYCNFREKRMEYSFMVALASLDVMVGVAPLERNIEMAKPARFWSFVQQTAQWEEFSSGKVVANFPLLSLSRFFFPRDDNTCNFNALHNYWSTLISCHSVAQ